MNTTTEQKKQKTPIEVKAWTGEEFLGRSFPPKEPLVEGLLARRDLVALGARRRNGKTSLLTHLAVALAVPAPDFIGYTIPGPRRSLLLILEDDPGEYQEKLKKVIGGTDTAGRIRIITRDDFREAKVPMDAKNQAFQTAVRKWTEQHEPDLVVIDNLAHIINAEYSDPTRVFEVMAFCYELAKSTNAAIILAAHPRKDDDDNPVRLETGPTRFFESIMGSSQFINATGSLWGLERREGQEHSVFVGGRQRGDGQQQTCYLTMNEDGWFELVAAADVNSQLVLNTEKRQQAWKLLPDHPKAFTYSEGEQLVRPALSSPSSYHGWMKQCRRLKVILDAENGKLVKYRELRHALKGAEKSRGNRVNDDYK
jgi:hypothetical protein